MYELNVKGDIKTEVNLWENEFFDLEDLCISWIQFKISIKLYMILLDKKLINNINIFKSSYNIKKILFFE